MAFTKVGYALANDFARKTFDQIRLDSSVLDSLRTAVLDSANTFGASVGSAPTDGAKWTHPQSRVKYDVAYRIDTDDSVTVTDIQPR